MNCKTLFLVFLLSFPIVSFADFDQTVPRYIAETAKKYGVDVQQALYVSYQESNWNCNAEGDFSTSTNRYTSFGCWQIHNPEEKKVRPLSIDQAKNLQVSTEWAMQTWSEDGGCFQWSVCPMKKLNKAPQLFLVANKLKM